MEEYTDDSSEIYSYIILLWMLVGTARDLHPPALGELGQRPRLLIVPVEQSLIVRL